MVTFITSGVLIGLHRQKVGQFLSIRKVTTILGGLLLVMVIIVALSWSDGGYMAGLTDQLVSLPSSRYAGRPSSLFDFPLGHVGHISMVDDSTQTRVPPQVIPDFDQVNSPGPELFSFADSLVTAGHLDRTLDTDFDLSNPPPILPLLPDRMPIDLGSNVKLFTASRLPDVHLVNPGWPPDVWLAGDTAVVEGVVTLRADGLVSFELRRDSHALQGFGDLVRAALNCSICTPALDSAGQAISVHYPYRCLFFDGGTPSIEFGREITAHLREGN